jgi:hypothetical protein
MIARLLVVACECEVAHRTAAYDPVFFEKNP